MPTQTPFNPVDLIKGAFPDAITDVINAYNELTIVINSTRVADVALFCRDTEGLEFNFLSDLVAVDYYPAEPRFAVCYHLYSIFFNRRLRLKAYMPGDDPHVPSVTAIWPSANWQEREAFDLMGIVFENHPDLRRILMPRDWVGHPLRKDYPLGYEPVQFSFNYDEIRRQKPAARE